MPYISYDPNKEGDRENAIFTAYIGYIVGCGVLGSIIYYFYKLSDFLSHRNVQDFLVALLVIISAAIIFFFYLFSNAEKSKKS